MKHRRGTSAKEAKQVLRLLVLSDSHGDAGSVYRAVAAQPEAAAVLYLGGRRRRPCGRGRRIPSPCLFIR